MMEFLAEYGLFLLKVATVVIAVVIIIASAAGASRKAGTQERLDVDDLNKKYKDVAAALNEAVMSKAEWKAAAKLQKREDKADSKAEEKRPRVFVIDFKGDLKASAVPSLREEVSAIVSVAAENDQVVAIIENYGGVVHEHGLAASQLARIRDRDLPLTVCVDKVAASGGYLMACVASRILAAPFAILGSIGVIAQLPNFSRLMDSHGVDYEQVTAGQYKRNVTMFGKNTDADRAKLKEELEDVHDLFKQAVLKYRPELDLDRVATGEHWYGSKAVELGLADEIRTSDELLAELAKDHDLYRISYKIRKPLQQRLLGGVDRAMEKFDAAGWRRHFESRLPR